MGDSQCGGVGGVEGYGREEGVCFGLGWDWAGGLIVRGREEEEREKDGRG